MLEGRCSAALEWSSSWYCGLRAPARKGAGFNPAYLVELSKMDQVTCFCTKLDQVTWICKILDQVTWSAQFAQGQITWFRKIVDQVTWFRKIVDQVTWETKCEDQITSTTISQKWTKSVLCGFGDVYFCCRLGTGAEMRGAG